LLISTAKLKHFERNTMDNLSLCIKIMPQTNNPKLNSGETFLFERKRASLLINYKFGVFPNGPK
jgi:hypothetical protein